MSIETAGAKAVQEIVSTINATMNPASAEIGNYIADKIRYLRYGSLLKIVKRAEENAKKQGMLLKMPPLKFFVPFAEAASLEEEDSMGSLQEAWANLLLNSTDDLDARRLLYIRILKEITGKEIEYLSRMIKDGRGVQEGVWLAAWWHYHDCTSFDQDWVFGLLRNIDPKAAILDQKDLGEFIVHNGEQPGLLFHSIEISTGDPYQDMVDISYIYDHTEVMRWKPVVDVLSALNLIRQFRYEHIPFEQDKHYSASVSGCVLTDLGIDFFDVCSGGAERKTPTP